MGALALLNPQVIAAAISAGTLLIKTFKRDPVTNQVSEIEIEGKIDVTKERNAETRRLIDEALAKDEPSPSDAG